MYPTPLQFNCKQQTTPPSTVLYGDLPLSRSYHVNRLPPHRKHGIHKEHRAFH